MTTRDQAIAILSTDNNANARAAFARKATALSDYVTNNVNPLEEQILLIREKLIPLYDAVEELRQQAIAYCTHPKDQIHVDETDTDFVVRCKFCCSTITVSKTNANG